MELEHTGAVASEYPYSECVDGCGNDAVEGTVEARTIFAAVSVPPGSTCDAVSRVQTRTCSNSAFTAWGPTPPVGEVWYEECEVECAPGCMLGNRTDGQRSDLCNVLECCFDNGEYTSWMLQQTSTAQWASLTGSVALANQTLDYLCRLGEQYDQDSAFGGVQQRDIVRAACVMHTQLENG